MYWRKSVCQVKCAISLWICVSCAVCCVLCAMCCVSCICIYMLYLSTEDLCVVCSALTIDSSVDCDCFLICVISRLPIARSLGVYACLIAGLICYDHRVLSGPVSLSLAPLSGRTEKLR